MYKVYLIGVYDNHNNLHTIKIGQTTQAVKARLHDIQKYANKSKALYNKGKHEILAYAEIDGINAGVIIEETTHKIITARYNTINKCKGAKDYFTVYHNISEQTIIKRFKTCMIDAVNIKNMDIISIKKIYK